MISLISLLQVTSPQLNDLNTAVDQLTESSIKIAEAASDYGALKVIFGIFMVFMILLLVLFVYQILTSNKRVQEIHQATQRTQEYFNGASDRTVGTLQAEILIRRNLNNISQVLKYYILRIRIENHICDETKTKEKVNKVVRNEYNELHTFLNNFICGDRSLAMVLNESDSDIIIHFMLEQIYMPQEEFRVFNMDQAADILMNGIKLDYIKKL